MDLDEIFAQRFALTPARYVGAVIAEEDPEDFSVRLTRLLGALDDQLAQAAHLEATMRTRLEGLTSER